MPRVVPTFQVDASSLNKVLANIKLVDAKAQKAFKQGLDEEGNRMLALAKEYCPVDTGRLRDSGEKLPHRGVYTEPGTKDCYVDISFGGKSVRGKPVDYALYVHEGFYHVRAGKQIKGRKFLERAVREVGRGMAERIASRVKL